MKKLNTYFLRYILSSLIVASFDYFIFWVSGYLVEITIVRVLLARSIAILIQYFLLKVKVFYSKLPNSKMFPFFIALVLVNAFLVSQIINLLAGLGMDQIIAKVIAEVGLYLPNYWVSKRWIFKSSENKSLPLES